MSTTNEAFIKAYRHDRPEPRAGVPLSAVRAGDLSQNGARQVAATTVANVPTAAEIPRPKTTQRSPNWTAGKRPLSSYLPHTPSAQDSRFDEPTAGPEFRPGTTVASFQWPAICRSLLQQCGPQLEQVNRLLWAQASEGKSLVGVFSLFRRGGATTTTLCLASRATSRGRRIILGDANFRNPQLANLLDVVPTAGWEEALRHTSSLNDAIVHAEDDRLDLLALGPRPVPDAQFRVEGLQAAVTAGILRHNYDLAIVDLGTFFDPVSQPVLLELVANMGMDAAIAVAGPKPADVRDIATIEEYFRHTNCEFLGIVENRIATPRAA